MTDTQKEPTADEKLEYILEADQDVRRADKALQGAKDDVKEARAGLECGIRLEGFDDIHVGDIIESYEIVKVARTL